MSQNINQYQIDKTFVWYNQLANQLPQMKRELYWLKQPYSQSLQAALNIANWGIQQYKQQTGQELPSAPVDWFEGLLSNIDGKSSTELKQEAHISLRFG